MIAIARAASPSWLGLTMIGPTRSGEVKSGCSQRWPEPVISRRPSARAIASPIGRDQQRLRVAPQQGREDQAVQNRAQGRTGRPREQQAAQGEAGDPGRDRGPDQDARRAPRRRRPW